MNKSLKIIVYTIIPILIIMIFGFILRIEDYRQWEKNPERAFYNSEPLLTNIDGYYYLRIARDYAEGNYSMEDPLRATPDGVLRRIPPPLLSWLAAKIHNLSGYSFNKIAAFLPPFLGVFLALPVYLIASSIGGRVMGCSAALFAILSNTYYTRTAIGWFDTDCLNVTLAFMSAYFFYKSISSRKNIQKYLYFCLGITTTYIFYLWWDMAIAVVLLVSLSPLLIATITHSKLDRRKISVFISIALVTLLIDYTRDSSFLVDFYNKIISYGKYVFGIETGIYPNVSKSVGEQRDLSVHTIVTLITDSYPLLILGVLGTIWVFIKEFRVMSILLIPTIIGMFGVFFAQRYLLFFGPIIAFGLSYIVYNLWQKSLKFPVLKVVTPLFLLISVAITTKTDLVTTQWTKFPPVMFSAFDYLSKNTPTNSVVWAMWDWGHPLIYYAKRGAISDGAYHSGETTVYNSIPYATDDYRLSANFMQFYVSNGQKGIHQFYHQLNLDENGALEVLKKLLAAGPEDAKVILSTMGGIKDSNLLIDDILRKLFPSNVRPLYFLLDYRLGMTSFWWYGFGTWNTQKHTGTWTRFIPYMEVVHDEKGMVVKDEAFANFMDGTILLKNQSKNIRQLRVYKFGEDFEQYDYENQSTAYLEIFADSGYAALQRKDIRESVFNKLFLRHEDSKYFEPIQRYTPSFQIYRVKADVYGQ